MATCNFVTTKFFPIVAMTDEEWESTGYDYNDSTMILDSINDQLLFFKAEFKSGYYEGVQLIFEEIYNPGEMDNEETREIFDLCRSRAILKYKGEIGKINKIIDKLCKEDFWSKYEVAARFSNGETWYNKI